MNGVALVNPFTSATGDICDPSSPESTIYDAPLQMTVELAGFLIYVTQTLIGEGFMVRSFGTFITLT